MAGVGFNLRKLVQRDDLLGIITGFFYSTWVTAGPWILTIVSLFLIIWISDVAGYQTIAEFRLIVIYNFAFSLAFTAPVFMVVTRYLADLVFSAGEESPDGKRSGESALDKVPGMLLGSVVLVFVSQFPLVAVFYLWYVEIEPAVRVAAMVNYFLVAGLWVVAVYLTALKAYHVISATFLVGLILSLLLAWLFAGTYSLAGMLMGFSIGLAVIMFGLIAYIFSEYTSDSREPFGFIRYFRRYWELALAGLFYNLAIWVDKWIMWLYAPEREMIIPGMPSYPDYDAAMFLAYLSIIPGLAMFVISVETNFFMQYLRFYRDIQKHVNFERIQRNLTRITASLTSGLRSMIVLQGGIVVLLLLLSPRLYELIGFSYTQIGMFRFGVLGAFFHVLLVMQFIILTYFDFRRLVLALQGLFLVTNIIFTFVSLNMGFPFYGAGYFASTLVTFAVTYLAMVRYVGELPYRTFVRDNLSVKRMPPSLQVISGDQR